MLPSLGSLNLRAAEQTTLRSPHRCRLQPLTERHVCTQGKRIGDVVNRMHVAVPKSRDGRTRPPVIPPSVRAAQQTAGQAAARKLQKDIQVLSVP